MCKLISLAIMYNLWPKKFIELSFFPHCSSLTLGTTSPTEQDDIIWLMRISGHTTVCFKGSLLSLSPYFLISLYKQGTENWENPFGWSELQIKSMIKFRQLHLRLFPFKHIKYIWISFLIMIMAIYCRAKWTLINTITGLLTNKNGRILQEIF